MEANAADSVTTYHFVLLFCSWHCPRSQPEIPLLHLDSSVLGPSLGQVEAHGRQPRDEEHQCGRRKPFLYSPVIIIRIHYAVKVRVSSVDFKAIKIWRIHRVCVHSIENLKLNFWGASSLLDHAHPIDEILEIFLVGVLRHWDVHGLVG